MKRRHVPSNTADMSLEPAERKDRSFREDDVYLSHSIDDIEWTNRLKNRLTDEGIYVRMNKLERKLHRLSATYDERPPGIGKLIAICSHNFFHDEDEQYLIEEILQHYSNFPVEKRHFIPILIDECRMPESWRKFKYIDFRNPDDFELRFLQLMQTLKPSQGRWESEKMEPSLEEYPDTAWSGDIVNRKKRQFVKNVAELYEAYGFEISYYRKNGRVAADFTIAKTEGGVSTERAVLCIEGRPDLADIEWVIEQIQLARQEERQTDWSLIFSEFLEADITQRLKEVGINPILYPQLVNSLIPLNKYNQKLIDDHDDWKAQNWQGQDWFIRPDVFIPDGDEREPALTHISRWLSDDNEPLLMILGDTGIGKSTLTRFLAYELAKNYCDDPFHHPAPLLVPLGEVRQEISLKGIMLGHLERNQTNVSDFRRFEHMAGMGKIVILFDAFDEMADHVRHDVIISNLAEVLSAPAKGWKVMLTCRTNYFKDYQDQLSMIEAAQEKLKESAASAVKIFPPLRSEAIYLADFSNEQVKKYLSKARPHSREQDWQKIEAIYNLKGLTQHPLLLEMILKSLSALQSGQSINAATLYTVYTNRWVEREEDKNRLLSKHTRLKLMIELAWKMWNDSRESISYLDLSAFVKDLAADPAFKIRAMEALDVIREIQTASFLKREHTNIGDKFSFAHPSFKEYFLARKLRDTLVKPENPNAVKRLLHTRLFSPHIIWFLTLLDEGDQVNRYLRLVLSDSYSALITENALQLIYWGVRFRYGAGEKIEDHGVLRDRLAIYLPRPLNMSGAVMQNMILEAADLRDADFQRADLANVNFNDAILQKANFRNANLRGASFTGADMANSDFTGAKNLEMANFTGANKAGAKGL